MGVVALLTSTAIAAEPFSSTNQPKPVVSASIENQGKAVQATARKADFGAPPPKKGIVVESPAKIRNPLQLINPFAPASYGTAPIVRDPITGEVRGVGLVGFRY